VDPIQATVKSYILEQFLPTADPAELTATTPLIAGGILDSLATVRLVTFLEEQYGIEVQAHEVGADNLDTLDLIAAMVRRKQAGGAKPGAR
jgi:acyl carrier protein